MSITSQTRSLQIRAKTLTYTEEEIEVKKILEGLDNDLNQTTVKLISDFPWDA